MKTFNNTLKTLLIGGVIAAFPMPEASAQGTLEEVTVTARKRDESLLDVPLAITAFTSDDIEKMDIKELTDIVEFSPGFHYAEHSIGRGGRFNRRLLFRGMNPRTDIQTRQGATVFIDGAPILGAEIGDTSNYERIEVIKGPQSAYFGRSTFSGAINAITRTPGNEWATKVSAEAASFGTSRFSAQIEGPLIEDKLAFRFNGSQYNTDGEYQNQANPSETLGAESTTDFGLTLFATPTENFSAKLRLHAWTDQDGPSVGIALSRADFPELFNCMPGGNASGDGTWICGEVPYIDPNRTTFLDSSLTPGLISQWYNPTALAAYGGVKVPFGQGLERHAHEISLNLDYEFANGMTLTSITASHSNEYASFEDLDRRQTRGEAGFIFGGTFNTGAETTQLTVHDLEDFSQEIRLTSSDEGSLRWMVGGSYSEIGYKTVGPLGFGGGAFPLALTVVTADPETTALFGSVGWDINDQFTLSVEGRYQEDKVIEGTVGGVERTGTFTSTTPRVILDYKPNEDTTFYATYSEGTNPGRFNTRILGLSAAELAQVGAAGANTSVEIDEEEITNFEFGIKSRFWGDRAQVSASVYFSEWEGLIATELVTITRDNPADNPVVQSDSNGGVADLSGLELEAEVLLSDNFLLEATLSITESDLKDFESTDAGGLIFNPPGTPPGAERTIDGLGKELSRYPTKSGTLSGTYTGTIGGDLDWYVRGDLIYRGSTWMTNANVTETGDATTFNLKIGFERDNWRVEAFGDNIFEEKGYTNLQFLADLSGQSFAPSNPACTFFCTRMVVAGYIPRPVYGLRATYEF